MSFSQYRPVRSTPDPLAIYFTVPALLVLLFASVHSSYYPRAAHTACSDPGGPIGIQNYGEEKGMIELVTLRGKAVQGAAQTKYNASPAPKGSGSSEVRASPRNGEFLGSTPSSIIPFILEHTACIEPCESVFNNRATLHIDRIIASTPKRIIRHIRSHLQHPYIA